MTDSDPTVQHAMKTRAARDLTAALIEAKLPILSRDATHIRFGWPDRGPDLRYELAVPADPDEADFDEAWKDVLAELERNAARGAIARQALGRITGIGCPRCGALVALGGDGVCAPCAKAMGWAA